MTRSHALRRPRTLMLTGASAVALMLAHPAAAQTLTGLKGALGLPGGAASGAGGAQTTAVLPVSAVTPSQAAQRTAQSTTDLNNAVSALKTQLTFQANQHAQAVATASTVPNGLGSGGLQQAGQSGTVLWQNANNATSQANADGTTTVTIDQTAQKAILTWNSFNVGKQTTVHFDQTAGTQSDGSNNWIVLNRITDPGGKPSQILGQIQAEGSVYLLNANGILFGGSSQVNVRSLVASSLNLFSNDLSASNSRFLTGGIGDLSAANFQTNSILLTTDRPGAGDIDIAPGASINLGSQGLGLIAAPNVTNGGQITAPSGQVALIAGIGVSYDYNASSFFSVNGNIPQGTNDNSTTVLRFANYGKLMDASGADITPVGVLINDGLIFTPQGNITLLGGAIQQNGTAIATTSVSRPGSIVITSLYEVGANSGSASPADEFNENFYTGTVSFGASAVTAVMPDTSGATIASDPTSLAPFQTQPAGGAFTGPLPTQGLGVISIIGQSIDFKGGSLTYAPGQSIAASAQVLPDPRSTAAQAAGAGRVLLEDGAVLDVSGIPDTELAMDSSQLTVKLAGNELADDPLQQMSFLFGSMITVDLRDQGINPETGEAWVGTPLGNLSSYENLVQQSINQLLVNGGAITITGNELVGEAGSTINLSGGYIHYLAGDVFTTRLLDASGHMVAIGQADPNDVYVGIAGQTTVNHGRWGVIDNYSNPLLDGSFGIYEPDDIQGGNAGALNIEIRGDNGNINSFPATPVANSGAVILQSSLLAGSVPGARQVASGILPTNGTFSFLGVRPIDIVGADGGATSAPPADFTSDTPLLATPDSPYALANVVSAQTLSDADFSSISMGAGGNLVGGPNQAITEEAGASLGVQAGGSISLTGDNVTINGALTARAGAISINTAAISGVGVSGVSSAPGDIVIGSGAVLDVSGFFVDDRQLPLNERGEPVMVNAGSISLVTTFGTSAGANVGVPDNVTDLTGNITLAAGSVLNLQGGGHVLANGQLQAGANGAPLGSGGSLTLETYLGLAQVSDTSAILGPDGLPQRGVLTMDGAIDALGFSGGGTLTLQQIGFQIGGDPAKTPTGSVYFDPTYWGDLGFGSFVLNATTTAVVPDNTTIRLQHKNLVPNQGAGGVPLGADAAAISTPGFLTGLQDSPTNLSITAGLEAARSGLQTTLGVDVALVGQGAEILADPGATISIDSYEMTEILGVIRAPGGTISLTVDANFNLPPPSGPLYLGPDSVLDVSGVVVLDPLASTVHTSAGFETPQTGTIYAGGTINLTDSSTSILVAPGAVLNVSGTSGSFQVPQLLPNVPLGGDPIVLAPQQQWSDAGEINITGGMGLVMEGTLIGHGGAPQAQGGTLSISGVELNGTTIISNLILVEDTAQALKDAGAHFDFSTFVPKIVPSAQFTLQVDPKVPGGDLLFGADSLDGSGFANLVLNDYAGSVGFTGKVTLNLSNSIIFNANGLIAANEGNYTWQFFGPGSLPGGLHPTTNGAALVANAPYIALNGTSANSGGFPSIVGRSTSDATVTFNAQQIDLSAYAFMQNIGLATFNSTGDIRLLPAQVISGALLGGYLESAGNFAFNAADIYPATDTAFVIQSVGAKGSVSFGYPDGVAPSNQAPLSAGGALVVSAANITQDGALQAPFGQIILGVDAGQTAISAALGGFRGNYLQSVATQSVTLGAGSVTSVSSHGAVIPFGATVDQTTWYYDPAASNPTWSGANTANLNNPAPVTAAPQGVVTVHGQSVNFNAGAVVDVSGGGDLQAQEWIPGTGGSRDVLSQLNTSFNTSATGTQVPLFPDDRGVFAIVPGFSGKVAPYDATMTQAGIATGQQIYLAGGKGLAAGWYTVLPAKYATLPGAFRVVINSGVTNPLSSKTFVLPDGTMDMVGYFGSGFNGARPSALSQFMVQPASTWERYSQYAISEASSFFPAYAALNGLVPPNVPNDAGRLVLTATTGLTIDGSLLGAAGPGGSGGEVDISTQFIQIVGAGEPVDPGYLAISAQSLDNLGAASLLIGGVRSKTADGTVITPTANGVIISNDAADPLTGEQILLVAAPQLQNATVQIDNEGHTAAIQTPVAGTGLVTIRSGSVIQATGSGSDVGGQTLILGNALDTLPLLPSSAVASDHNAQGVNPTAFEIGLYYQMLDSALGTLVDVSSGAPDKVQLPTPAQISPGVIPVQDNLGPNPKFTIVLPSLVGAASGTGAVIDSGSQITGGANLVLASTGGVDVRSGASLSAKNISAISSSITFVGADSSAAAPTAGLTIDAGLLAQLEQSSNLELQSYGDIDFQGDVDIQMGATSALTLGGGRLLGDGGSVTISAPTVTLNNALNAPTPTSTSGSGTLTVNAGELVFGDGAKSISGFARANLTATQAVVGQGTGEMNFGVAAVSLQTPIVIADTDSSQALTTTGALSVAAITASGPPPASDALGGQIVLEGGSVTVSAPIQALAGNITLVATAGDVTIADGSALTTHGVAKTFGGTTEYASGGMITLATDGGTVIVAPTAVLDFAGATGGGDGGGLSITTADSTAAVQLGGALKGATAAGYAGSMFNLDTGGAVDLDNLAQLLTNAAVTGGVSVEAAQGDLSLSSTLTASRVALVADSGMVDVTGSIAAKGAAAAVGQIELYGAKGVDVEGSLTATGSPNSQKPGGLITIGTEGVGSNTSLNPTYGYENVDPSASGVITIGSHAVIDASGGAVTLRAPILDADNAQGSNVNVAIASGAQIRGGAVLLDAYAVWSTADQSTSPSQHFDGFVDPAGWYNSAGVLMPGAFTDIAGNPVATWDGSTLVNQDNTTNGLSYYLTNDYFAPNAANADHAVFYGGYDPNIQTFDPANPQAGSLPAFVQQPGFHLGAAFAGVANFQARPEIDLINPSPADGGVNGGNITVLTNWNLGAGVMNPDGSLTLAYRYQGVVAPVLSLRAAGDVRLDATISDGFFQTVSVVLPSGPPPLGANYAGALALYGSLVSEGVDLGSTTQISLFNGSTQILGALDPNIALAVPQQGGTMEYYQNYEDYVINLYLTWSADFPENNGLFLPITPTSILAPNAPSASDPQYATDYANYLAAYDMWLQANFNGGTMHTAGTPPGPQAPVNSAQYEAYIGEDLNYINYAFDFLFDPSTSTTDYIFAPISPTFVASTGGGGGAPPPPPVPASANAPSNMGTATDPLPVQFAALIAGQSSSYRIVAGAALGSPDPLAVANAATFAPGAGNGLGGEGNVVIDGHVALQQVNATNAQIATPTTIRTGTGSIDIAAAGDFEILDQLAPGVIYTAGAPVQPVASDGASIAASQGATNMTTGAGTGAAGTGVSTILTSEVNPGNAGDITLTVRGDIFGFQNVVDTLATGNPGGGFNPGLASGLSSNPGAFLGQFWLPWLLTNPNNASVPWYVNFGSFDQGVMSIGGNVTVKAGGDIHDLGVSLPTTAYLDSSNALHVTGGGDLSVTAGGSIYSGDFYVGQGAGSIRAGGAIASDFTYLSDSASSYPVETVLAVQYGVIGVQARQSVDIGGVYDPTYLWAPGILNGESWAPVSALKSIPYVVSMSPDSGVSIQSMGGDVTFNSLIIQGALFNLGQKTTSANPNTNPDDDAVVSSLLLPASLSLVALEGGVDVEHGGGLYPSTTGTLTIVADQSIDLALPVITGVNGFGAVATGLPSFGLVGNVSGVTLGKLDVLVGTGILPTAANPQLQDASFLTPTQIRDPALVQDNPTASVLIYALNGSLQDGSLLNAATIGQISLVPNAPATVYAGQDILDLPFFGENFNADDITSIIAGRDIRYNPLGNGQVETIELAGPGTLDVEAGRDLNFQTQRATGSPETGIRTLGNSIDPSANPLGLPLANFVFTGTNLLPLQYGNPNLSKGGATVNVLFGVGPGMDQAAFINQYINPANASTSAPFSLATLTAFVDQYETAAGNSAAAPTTADQAWAIFQTLPAAQQQLLVGKVFTEVLNTTGEDYNNPSSPFFHQYARGYEAINTLFPASLGYTQNSLDGGTNGANQLVTTGNFDMRGSTVQTQQGGDISIFGPGGRILVGSSTASPAIDPASEGILTLEQGSIAIFADTDVLVAQSRVMTEQGGGIVMWSSNGNLDAGKGVKTSVSAPPPLYACDIDFICVADVKGEVSGAGIATLQSLPGVPVGDADLIAPRGTVDAGAAGIRVSGNLNIAALQVLNAFNIQVQGQSFGLPAPAATNLALTTTDAASKEVNRVLQDMNNQQRRQSLESIVTVEVTGFGGDGDEPTECISSASHDCSKP